MLIDKVGGTLTSAAMLLYGPGSALGFKSSEERFERMAKANMMYQSRYIESERALIKLAEKQIKLEESLTAKGKARAKIEQDAAEQKRIALSKEAKAIKDASEADAKKHKDYIDGLDEELNMP